MYAAKTPMAYEPKVVSIGPYHRDKNDLIITGEHKLRYLKGLLTRRGETSVEKYVAAIRQRKEEARMFYEELPAGYREEDFVEMLLLDGCFIVEFFHKCYRRGWADKNDAIFHQEWLPNEVLRDLLLLENQIPFFVLLTLFRMTRAEDMADVVSLIQGAYNCCKLCPHEDNERIHLNRIVETDVDHLLGLIHKSWCPFDCMDSNVADWKFTKSATELREAGIKLKKIDGPVSWLDIQFNNGVLEIPPIMIQDRSEDILRNLLAYEQHSLFNFYSKNYISDYLAFMDSLINTPEDVIKLCRSGIIDHLLGDNGAVSTMFNNLGHGALINPKKFIYKEVCAAVNKHCQRKRNTWLANLKRNYFNSPWSIISFVAALVLLIFTALQTLFTILSYFTQI